MGRLARIVEAADATNAELRVRRVNAGIDALPALDIFAELARLGTDNAKGEYYLTDALVAAAAAKKPVALFALADPTEAFGVNDRRDLAAVHHTTLRRRVDELMRSGVTVLDPERTWIEPASRWGSTPSSTPA